MSDSVTDCAQTAVERVEATLSAVEVCDPVLNSFITVTADAALEAAAVADSERARRTHHGPMHGVPVGIKDAIDVAGVRCTFGSKILEHRSATDDAAVVTLLRRAGAVIVGKQNLHEFAYGITGENPHFGDTANPWDPTRITGGSSGGTAAAIAAGLVTAGLGTDTGGSVRIPAAMCGVVGLKPTYDAVSRAGVLPLAPSLDHVGPLARGVLECFELLEVITGAPGSAMASSTGAVSAVRTAADAGLDGIRVGIPAQHFFEDLDSGVDAAVRRAIDVLVDLGAHLVEVQLPTAVRAQSAAAPIMGSEAAAWHDRWLHERADDYGRDVLERLRQGAATDEDDRTAAEALRTTLRREFVAAFGSVDVIVSPTVPIVAPERGRTFEPSSVGGATPRSVINRLTVPANLTGFPALSVPCGAADGLPVGLQLMGRAHDEVRLGGIALAYERVTNWHEIRPAIST